MATLSAVGIEVEFRSCWVCYIYFFFSRVVFPGARGGFGGRESLRAGALIPRLRGGNYDTLIMMPKVANSFIPGGP